MGLGKDQSRDRQIERVAAIAPMALRPISKIEPRANYVTPNAWADVSNKMLGLVMGTRLAVHINDPVVKVVVKQDVFDSLLWQYDIANPGNSIPERIWLNGVEIVGDAIP